MAKNFTVSNYLKSHAVLAEKLDKDVIHKAIQTIQQVFEDGHKVITCGNGGSAIAASHYITDWNKMANLATGKKFKGISLCDNIGLLTAYGNDLSYEDVFSGQLASIGQKGDLLIAISGSGNSPNVLKAVEYANNNEIDTLGIIGYDGGKLISIVRQAFLVPSYDMQLCEDMHVMFGHMVMKTLCSYGIED
jgi:D-sedoheptulose 7-phosphate isomerase